MPGDLMPRRLAYDSRQPAAPREHETDERRRKVIATQNVSRMCLVCGTENSLGLHARFYELEGGELLGVFTPRHEHQSYPGRLHGGISSAILDETIGRAILITHPELFGVTAEFSVRFRQPVPLDTEIRAVGRITRDRSRVFEGSGEIMLQDGSVAVEGHGRYVKMPIETIAEGGAWAGQWFSDERERPVDVALPSSGQTSGSATAGLTSPNVTGAVEGDVSDDETTRRT
jgi:acyl-coenzyme A thioesterase PaaI-like protein